MFDQFEVSNSVSVEYYVLTNGNRQSIRKHNAFFQSLIVHSLSLYNYIAKQVFVQIY